MTTVGASNKEFWNHCKLAIDYQMSFGDNNIQQQMGDALDKNDKKEMRGSMLQFMLDWIQILFQLVVGYFSSKSACLVKLKVQ